MADVELYVLDERFEHIAIIRDFSSLQWNQKYYEPGTFQLVVGAQYAHLLPDARYLYKAGTGALGVIDQPKFDNMKALTLKGRMAEVLLMRTVVNKRLPYDGSATMDSTRVTYTGSVEDVCRQIVDEYCIHNDEPERNMARLQLGAPSGLFSEQITLQPLGETVYDVIRDTLTAYEMSFRLRYDFVENLLYFEVYQGLDRTQNQVENDWCVFSSELYNVVSESFTRSLDTRNFCYVVNGDEDKNEDEFTTIIRIDDGRPRAELWVRDNTRLTAEMTEEEFEQAIRQTGLNKLAQFNVADTGECVIDDNNTMTYGLGDRCTYINPEIGITLFQRITEIREVIEDREVSRTAVIGKDQLTEQKKIMRDLGGAAP